MSITKSRKISRLLLGGTNEIRPESLDSDSIVLSAAKGATSGAGTDVYSTLGDLPGSANTGAQAFVSANNGLYIYNGSGWYKVALVNATPYWDTEAAASYDFTIDTAITITLLAGDSDGHGITYTATPDSDANLFITISKDSDNGRIFTLTPDSENEAPANSNTGTITFKASDGISFASTVSSFTLIFANIISNSAETVLLMKADGNNATNAAITYQNSSDVSTGFTETGDPQASTFSPYRSGGYSAYFDGTDDYISFPYDANLVLNTSFTIEFWTYMLSGGGGGYGEVSFYQMGEHDFRIDGANDGTTLKLMINQSDDVLNITSGIDLLNHWHHIALSYDGTTLRIFVDGILKGSVTRNITQTNTGGNMAIGINTASVGDVFDYKGYISDLRHIRGTAVYTSAFTPPTERLTAITNTEILTCHLPYFADGSTNDHSITANGNASTQPFGPYDYEPWAADDHGGSVYFDNTAGDRILTSATSAIGTSDFTIEAWVYPNSFSTQEPIICCSDDTSGDTNNWYFLLDANGDLVFRYNGSTSVVSTAGTVLNTWNHVAVTATGGTIYLWVNGKTDTNVSYSHNYTDSRIKIGVNRSHTQTFNGYIADARVIIGTAQYTSNFTPPTAPLGHITNTNLLMNNKSDANVYDAAAANGLTLIGNTTTNNSTRKFTTSSSVYFDGTGDYITVNHEALGTGNWTIEGWVRFNTISNQYIFDFRNASSANTNPALDIQNDWRYITDNDYRISTGVTPSANTWYHFAVVKNNGTTTLYINGSSLGTYSDALDYVGEPSAAIGVFRTKAAAYLNGYLQDFRVTKGLARYTTTFTPPTAEFEL